LYLSEFISFLNLFPNIVLFLKVFTLVIFT